GVRRHPARPAGLQDVVLGQQGLRAADAAAHHDREAVLGHARLAGLRPGLPGRDQRELFGPVEPAGLHAVDLLEGRLCQLGRDAHRKLLGPVVGQLVDPGPAGEERFPGRRDVPAERGGRAEPGDDDLNSHALLFRMYETASPTVFRFWTSSSGILTSNFSSAATTTSTIDSESTSRSSVNDLPSATSSGLTPATSSRISARPSTTWVRSMLSRFPSLFVTYGQRTTWPA